MDRSFIIAFGFLACSKTNPPVPVIQTCPVAGQGGTYTGVSGASGMGGSLEGSGGVLGASGAGGQMPGQICNSNFTIQDNAGDVCAACLGSNPNCCNAFMLCDENCYYCLAGIGAVGCDQIDPIPLIIQCTTSICGTPCSPSNFGAGNGG